MRPLLNRESPNSSNPSSPFPSSVADLTDYCSRRLAGLETGPVPDIGPGSAAAIWTLFGAATVFLSLRVYCKVWRSRGVWWDDVVLVISWVCTMFLTSAILCQRVIAHGLGKYPCDIPVQNLPVIAFEGAGLGSVFTILGIVWSKTSFGITLLRLLTRDGWLRRSILGVVVVMNVSMLLQAVFVWVKCDPVEKNWRPLVPGRCWNLGVSNGYGFFSGVLSGVCDVLFAVLPWHLVWGLKMRKKEKIGVVVAMSMGVFAGATAFVKSSLLLTMGSKNFTHDGCHLIVWAAAEIATTIMAASIPVLRVLFRDLRDPHPIGTGGTGSRKYHQHRKSGNSGETSDGDANSPAAAVALTRLTGAQGVEIETASKPWGAYWDFGKGSRRLSRMLGAGLKGTGVTAAEPYPLAQNSSRRVLVQGSGESNGEEMAQAEGVIVQTQEFEIRYSVPGGIERVDMP